MLDISINTEEIQSHLDLLPCFLNSANSLRALAFDGIFKNINGSLGQPTNEHWNEHLVTAFFLLRHSIELGVKALIKVVTGKDETGHNIQCLWEKIPNYEKILTENIPTAFCILKKYHLLEDAQLFRYHADKHGNKLKDLGLIENSEFEVLYGTAWAIHGAVLECVHHQKELP